jgi:hypothetical protein
VEEDDALKVVVVVARVPSDPSASEPIPQTFPCSLPLPAWVIVMVLLALPVLVVVVVVLVVLAEAGIQFWARH